MIGTAAEVREWLAGQDQGGLYDCRPRKRKRTLTQNAYYWALLNQLARTLGMGDSELHGHMLREYGVADTFTVRADVPLRSYFRYFDVIGGGQMDGVRYSHVRVYKGSSEMDSSEFGRLLDGMREECEIQGIPTLTRAEIAKLRWMEGEG